MTKAPFMGFPRIFKLSPNSSVNIVLSQTDLSDVILSTIFLRYSPSNPFSI
jgi:hypothetical protein